MNKYNVKICSRYVSYVKRLLELELQKYCINGNQNTVVLNIKYH